ncbi:MAG: hypothetical protein AAF074_10145 [Pseudomonadota bacterium]
MQSKAFKLGVRALVCGVSTVALTAGVAAGQSAADLALFELSSEGRYLSGDFHNHTTCTDGAMSVDTVVNESLFTYELDWFAQTGHGGGGSRDCRFNDPEYDGSNSGEGSFWTDTLAEDEFGGGGNGDRVWRWQSLTEFAFQLQRNAGESADKPVWLGIEHNTPGHEHISMAILDEQYEGFGNAYSTGQFNYLWDRGDQNDDSGGDENDFENPANNGVAKTFGDTTGTEGHEKSVRAVEWMRDNFGDLGYFVPAHVERQGGFVSDANRGYNVEHFRDYYNAGLLNPNDPTGESIAFGAEMLAGHQFANGGRGTYEADRPTAGLGTYGGAGAYSGAEVALPGKDFDGNDLTNATLNEIRAELNALFENRLTEPSGSDQYDQLDACSDCADEAPEGIGTSPRERLVLGRPGLATMWDALLAEGRRFYNFSNSDWHNRGQFGPFEPQSTLDPWPGEYNKTYVYSDEGDDFGFAQSKRIIREMRQGNSWSVHGDLIDEFYMVLCQGNTCATLGETLTARPARGDLTWKIVLRDPEGTNNSPYAFANPSLVQLGMDVPLNEPKVSHVDIIRGDITGLITPDMPEYTTVNSNPTVELFARIDNMAGEFSEQEGRLVAEGTIPFSSIEGDFYLRVRGTNMPVGTPNETDADGNPLLDDFSSLIPCTATGAGGTQTVEVSSAAGSSFNVRNQLNALFDPLACPDHLPVDADGVKYLDADVEAWADLWFYANPIFVEVR